MLVAPKIKRELEPSYNFQIYLGKRKKSVYMNICELSANQKKKRKKTKAINKRGKKKK